MYEEGRGRRIGSFLEPYYSLLKFCVLLEEGEREEGGKENSQGSRQTVW